MGGIKRAMSEGICRRTFWTVAVFACVACMLTACQQAEGVDRTPRRWRDMKRRYRKGSR